MTSPAELSPERLREILRYDPETGEFRWLEQVSNRVKAGDIAGCAEATGYRRIRIAGRCYRAHQLAWFYMTGEWGRPTIDHRDRDPSNNRWSNLRRATQSDNNANRRFQRSNPSGFKGIHFDKKSGKWVARLGKDGRSYYLGRFATPQEAHAAYVALAEELYGEFASGE